MLDRYIHIKEAETAKRQFSQSVSHSEGQVSNSEGLPSPDTSFEFHSPEPLPKKQRTVNDESDSSVHASPPLPILPDCSQDAEIARRLFFGKHFQRSCKSAP